MVKCPFSEEMCPKMKFFLWKNGIKMKFFEGKNLLF